MGQKSGQGTPTRRAIRDGHKNSKTKSAKSETGNRTTIKVARSVPRGQGAVRPEKAELSHGYRLGYSQTVDRHLSLVKKSTLLQERIMLVQYRNHFESGSVEGLLIFQDDSWDVFVRMVDLSCCGFDVVPRKLNSANIRAVKYEIGSMMDYVVRSSRKTNWEYERFQAIDCISESPEFRQVLWRIAEGMPVCARVKDGDQSSSYYGRLALRRTFELNMVRKSVALVVELDLEKCQGIRIGDPETTLVVASASSLVQYIPIHKRWMSAVIEDLDQRIEGYFTDLGEHFFLVDDFSLYMGWEGRYVVHRSRLIDLGRCSDDTIMLKHSDPNGDIFGEHCMCAKSLGQLSSWLDVLTLLEGDMLYAFELFDESDYEYGEFIYVGNVLEQRGDSIEILDHSITSLERGTVVEEIDSLIRIWFDGPYLRQWRRYFREEAHSAEWNRQQ